MEIVFGSATNQSKHMIDDEGLFILCLRYLQKQNTYIVVSNSEHGSYLFLPPFFQGLFSSQGTINIHTFPCFFFVNGLMEISATVPLERSSNIIENFNKYGSIAIFTINVLRIFFEQCILRIARISNSVNPINFVDSLSGNYKLHA